MESSYSPFYTQAAEKTIRVYVDKDIEFNMDIANDNLTCGWLLSEVTRQYIIALNKQKDLSPGRKHLRNFIVALKTPDQNEAIDYWLTQYER